MRQEPEAGGGLNVLSKAQNAVEAIASAGALTASELASRLNEPVSSVYRLLANLTELKWVERGDSRGDYRLGARFLWLGDRLESQLDVRTVASPSLRLLHAATGQTVFLCIRSEDRATCIERIDGQDVQIQRLRLGHSLPLHEGASPRVLLAFQSARFVDEYVTSAFTDVAVRDRVREEVRGIRARGYVLADDEAASGIRSVGAPIFDHRGQIVAALSVSGLRQREIVDSESTIRAVVQEAARASAALGFDGAPRSGGGGGGG